VAQSNGRDAPIPGLLALALQSCRPRDRRRPDRRRARGAVIGAIAGGGRGAGIDAAVGGSGVGAITGVATTPQRPHHRYYRHHVVNRTYRDV
jgi:hypothetical protein